MIDAIRENINVNRIPIPDYEEEKQPIRRAPPAIKSAAPPAKPIPATPKSIPNPKPVSPSKSTQSPPQKTNTLIIILPIGIPAMGKPFCAKDITRECRKLGWTVDTLSSDTIRAEMIKRYLGRSRNWDEAFQKTHGPARDEFFRQLDELISAQKDKHVIFLDKNHPPAILGQTVEHIEGTSPPSTDLRLIGLIPSSSSTLTIGTEVFPFDLSFLVTCFQRLKDREEHETMIGPLEKRLSVAAMMFKMYSGISNIESWLPLHGVDHVIRYSFTQAIDKYSDRRIETAIPALLGAMASGKLPSEEQIAPIAAIFSKMKTKFPMPNTKGEILSQIDIILPKITREKSAPQKVPGMLTVKYYALDFMAQLSGSIVGLLQSVMYFFKTEYPQDLSVQTDADAILSHVGQFSPAQIMAGNWQFPEDLKLVTHRKSPDSPEVSVRLNPAEIYTWSLNYIYYIPNRIICACGNNIGQEMTITAPNPHLTLLTSQWSSEHALSAVSASQYTGNSYFKKQVEISGEMHFVYIMKLSPTWIVTGSHKGYTN